MPKANIYSTVLLWTSVHYNSRQWILERVPERNPSQVLPLDVHPTEWDTRISLDILAKGSHDGKWELHRLEEKYYQCGQLDTINWYSALRLLSTPVHG